jgi:hypothetical protein
VSGSGSPAPPRVRKHLMDPNNVRPQNRDPMSLGRVQRWVLSTLAATTIMHMALGLVVGAAFADRLDAQIGLLVIGSAFGVLAILAALVIHQVRPFSPWLLLGLAPTAVGALIIF